MNKIVEEKKFFEDRLKKLRERLENSGADGMIILKDENIFYITGFYGYDSGSVLLVTPREVFLIVHFIYFEKAKTSMVPEGINLIEFRSRRDDTVEKVLHETAGINFGIESSFVDYDSYNKYKNLLKKTGKKIVNMPQFIETQRIIKDRLELSAINEACRIADDAIKNVMDMDQEKISGFTEIGLALYIEELMVKKGASAKSFNLIVAGNASSSLPHYEPSLTKIVNGPLLFDIGCIYGRYCSDITRTLFVEKMQVHTGCRINDKIKEIYDIVLESQLLALQECRAGITCRKLDSLARDFIEKKGYGEHFGHGLGHGVGLEVHEGPTVSARDDTVLQENMVITLEPGIYLEGIGGVRIEDMVIVEKDGCRNLYTCTKTASYIGKV